MSDVSISKTKFVATFGESVQVGMEEWEYRCTSRVFDNDSTMDDVLDWGRALGIMNICITQITFSNYSD